MVYQYVVREAIGKRLGKVSCDISRALFELKSILHLQAATSMHMHVACSALKTPGSPHRTRLLVVPADHRPADGRCRPHRRRRAG